MMGICSRPEVGVVGAKLFYPDETIQHAGVVMKLAGCCGHVFYGAEKEDPGSYARATIIQNFSAVTAACFMCRRQVWDRLGGLSTEFQVAYNDVDFCLRVREAGYLVTFTLVSGGKVELYTMEKDYQQLTDGQEGILTWEGESFLCFEIKED
jgi:GT2 family glycosyltransferase